MATGLNCPSCSSWISWRQIQRRFRCPACGTTAYISRTYLASKGFLDITVAGGLVYLAGARSAGTLVAGTLVALFPVSVLGWTVGRRVMPPTLHADYRDTLYGGDRGES